MAKRSPTLHIRRSRNGRGKLCFYWKLVAANGRVIAIGGEPFSRRSGALRAYNTTRVAFIQLGFQRLVRGTGRGVVQP